MFTNFSSHYTGSTVTPVMDSSEKLCLKWDDFHINISSAFSNMRNDEYFSDVTLVSDGDQKIEAHKIILAASSSFFDKLLKQNKHPNPLLYMRGINAIQLGAIVDFIYYGEVNIFEQNLEEFLTLAEELHLRGLNNSSAESKDPRQIPPPEKLPKPRTVSNQLSLNHFKDNTKYHSDLTIKENTLVVADTSVRTKPNNEELDDTINTMLETLKNGQHSCKVCGKIDPTNHLNNLKRHIEAKHIEGTSHPCSQCGKYFRSRHSLSTHTSMNHKSK